MEKQWVLYIIQCSDGTLYTGITDDLSHRLRVHGTAKGAKYTLGRGPFVLRYTESCTDHSAALKREYYIKHLTKAEKLSLCKQYMKEKTD